MRVVVCFAVLSDLWMEMLICLLGTDGFSAVKGWDPVTGLGTPDYDKLLSVFMALD